MFEAIHRVISGDNVQDEQQQQHRSNEEQTQQGSNTTSNNNSNNTSNIPMVVEPDQDSHSSQDHDAPFHLIASANRHNSDALSTSSSLSDASQEGETKDQVDVYMEDVLVGVEGSPTPLAGVGSGPQLHQHPPAHYQQHLQQRHRDSRLQRMDSSDGSDSGSARATTSQNSSRDWGWFEDVHQSGQLTPTGSLTNRNRKSGGGNDRGNSKGKHTHRPTDPNDETAAAAMAVTAPTYVLEESLSSQRLWKYTAGNRPPQPVEERAFFEAMWKQNFARSQVNYQMPVEVLTAASPIALSPFADGGAMEISPEAAAGGDGGNYQHYSIGMNTPANTHMMMPSSRTNKGDGDSPEAEKDDAIARSGLKEAPREAPPTVLPPMTVSQTMNQTAKTASGDNLKVLVRGDNVFGTTVSKSFACTDEKGGPITGVDTVNISIASYRVVESSKNGKYAQFLVIYREGSIRDTIGVWKRYSDFDDLAKKVTQAHEGCASVIANMSPLSVTEEHDVEHLPNAITSWRLLKKRQRWFRCLDAGYLSLKVFLLERFLHDILFESSSPMLLREFVGTDESASN